LATLERIQGDTLSDADDDNGSDSRQWYCYLGLRLRLQQGELPGGGDAALGFFGEA
jgi:hypothetical protein